MNKIDHYYKVSKSNVSFICTYLEAFEGMSAIRTPNPKMGEDTVLHVMVSQDFSDQFTKLIGAFTKHIKMEEVQP